MSRVFDLLKATSATLADAGIDSPQAQARTLICYCLGLSPTRLALVDNLTDAQEALLQTALEQRLAGRPIQHITGEAFFRTVSVRVGPGVFIPRPETEILAGWAIDQVTPGKTRIVELCAGSGAISLAIAAESDPREQWAVEIDPRAYTYLKANLAATAVHPVLGDMANSLPSLDATIDLVVANPPYLRASLADHLPDEVALDPDLALFSGDDGLDATRVVAKVARRLLKPGGVVGSEHGEDQAEDVAQIFCAAGFDQVRTCVDLAERPRFVVAR